jgi:hypothetical protein
MYFCITKSPGGGAGKGDMVLINKQVAQSDFSGSINTEVSGPFESGQVYMIVGISDPNISLSLDGFLIGVFHMIISKLYLRFPIKHQPIVTPAHLGSAFM